MQASGFDMSYNACILQLRRLIDSLHHKGGWPYSRLHLFGFSQGGTACLGAAICFTNNERQVQQNRVQQNCVLGLNANKSSIPLCRLGSCISISGPLMQQEISGHVDQTTPILITHGENDLEVSRAKIQQTVTALTAIGKSMKCPGSLEREPKFQTRKP